MAKIGWMLVPYFSPTYEMFAVDLLHLVVE